MKRNIAVKLFSRTQKWVLCCLVVLLASLSLSPRVSAAPEDWTSLSGNYLAAREASLAKDNANAADYFIRALKLDPKNKTLLGNTLLLLLKTGDYDRATEYAQRLYALDPGDVKAANFLALKAIKQNDFALARKIVNKTDEFPIGKLSFTLIKAWSLAGEKKVDEAIALLETLSAYDNFTTFRLFHSALIQDFSQNKREAERLYKLSYEEAGQFMRVIQAYGAFLEKNGKTTEALRIYEEFLKNNPDEVVIESALKGLSNNKMNKPIVTSVIDGAAEAMFNISRATFYDEATVGLSMLYLRFSLFLDEKNDLSLNQLGQIYEILEDYEKAIKAFEEVSPSSPLYTDSVIEISENLNRLEKKVQARRKLRLLLYKKSENVKPVFVLGNLLRHQEKYKAASKAYTRALKMVEPHQVQHWRLFYYRGISYERTKQWNRAEKDFLNALKLQPDQADVLNYLGYSWIEQKKNLKKAMDMIRKANKFKPNDGYIIDSLGWAHFKLGNFEKAVQHLERAVSFKPEDPIINDHLGDAYWEAGRRLEAGFQWNHAKFQLQKRLKEKEKADDVELLEKVEEKILEKSLPHAKNLRLKNLGKSGNPL